MSRINVIEVEKSAFHRYLPWIIFLVGATFYCYEYLLRIAPSVMSDSLMSTFKLNAGQYGNMIAFYYYAYTPMQLVIGLLMDRYGPRYLLMLACTACFSGAFIFAHSHVFWMAATGRFLIGFGSAFAFVGALKLATIWLPANRFAMISGIVTSLGMIGAMIGDDTLSSLVKHTGWRTLHVSLSLIGILIAVAILFLVKDKLETTLHDAYVPEYKFQDVFAHGIQSLKKRNIWLNGIVGLFLYLSLSAFAELWAIPFLTQARHLPKSQATSIVTMIFLGWAIGGPFAGWFSDFFKTRKVPLVVGSLLATITICIALYAPNLSAGALYLIFFLFGIFTSVQIIIFAVAKDAAAKELAATAIALTNLFVMMGGVIFQPLFGVILDHCWQGATNANGIHIYSLHAYQTALSILPVGLLLCSFIIFFYEKT